MSFEEMILAHAAALRDNAEALRANAAATMKLAEAMGTINAIAKPAAAPAAEPEKPKASKPPKAEKPAEEKKPEIALADVRAALMSLPDKRDATNIIGRFGVSKLSEVPVECYPELLDEVAKVKSALGGDPLE